MAYFEKTFFWSAALAERLAHFLSTDHLSFHFTKILGLPTNFTNLESPLELGITSCMGQ